MIFERAQAAMVWPRARKPSSIAWPRPREAPVRTITFGLLILSPLVELANTIKESAKEESATGVNAESVAEFVESPVIVRRVDYNIFAEEQRGHSAGHESTMEHSATKPGGLRSCVGGRSGFVENPTPTPGDCDDQG